MPLMLVLHDITAPDKEVEEDFFHTFFVVAPDHWRVAPNATLVGTDLSADYLSQHLRGTAKRVGVTLRMLMIMRVPDQLATHGLPPEGEAWMREMRD